MPGSRCPACYIPSDSLVKPAEYQMTLKQNNYYDDDILEMKHSCDAGETVASSHLRDHSQCVLMCV